MKGTRQPPDGGARQQFYCTPGVLIFSCICSSSDFISGYVFGYFPSSSVSLYFSDSFDFLVVFISCDLMFFDVFISFYLCCFVFLFFLFPCIRVASERMFLPVIAQHNGIALYYCGLPGST